MPYYRQKEVIEYLSSELTKMDGIRALYLKGSLAYESDDEYSDVDFYCLVEENKFEEILEVRLDLLSKFKPIVYKSYVNFGDPQIVVIYDNDLHLDFYLKKELSAAEKGKIKVLYDKDNILETYQSKEEDINKINIANYLNGVIYTYHELNIAIKRNDYLWAHRLQSHILADLSLILDNEFEKDKSYCHMKGLLNKVPNELHDELLEVLKKSKIDNFYESTELLVQLTEKIIQRQSLDILNKVDRTYLDFIKKNHF